MLQEPGAAGLRRGGYRLPQHVDHDALPGGKAGQQAVAEQGKGQGSSVGRLDGEGESAGGRVEVRKENRYSPSKDSRN